MVKRCRTKATIRIGDKCISRKKIKEYIQLYGKIGSVLAISDTFGLDEDAVKMAIKKIR